MMSPNELYRFVVESIRRLFTTPIEAWTWGQVFLALFLLSLVTSCFSRCLCCGRRSRRRYYYRRDRDRNRNRIYDDEEDDYNYQAYNNNHNNHPGGRLVQSYSIPMVQQNRQTAGAPAASSRTRDPPALSPYNMTV